MDSRVCSPHEFTRRISHIHGRKDAKLQRPLREGSQSKRGAPQGDRVTNPCMAEDAIYTSDTFKEVYNRTIQWPPLRPNSHLEESTETYFGSLLVLPASYGV